MRTFFRTIYLFLLFCLLLSIITLFLIQTDFAKEQFKTLLIKQIEKKTGVAITAYKLDGLLPLSVKLHDVTVELEGMQVATFKELTAYLSPISFFSNPFVIHRLTTKKGWLKGVGFGGEKVPWPKLDKGFTIQSMHHKDLVISSYPPLNVTGSASFKDDFSLRLDVGFSGEGIPFLSTHIEGEEEISKVHMMTHLINPPGIDASLWITSTTDWYTLDTTGELMGKGDLPKELVKWGERWEARGDFHLTPNFELTLSSAYLKSTYLNADLGAKLHVTRKGIFGDTHLHGHWFDSPIDLDTSIALTQQHSIDLPHVALSYLDSTLAGDLSIHLPKQLEDETLVTGTLKGSFANFATLFDAFSTTAGTVKGKGEGSVTFFIVDQIGQGVEFDLKTKGLVAKGFAIDDASVQGSVHLIEGEPIIFDLDLGGQEAKGSYDARTKELILDAKVDTFELVRIFPDYIEGGTISGLVSLQGPTHDLNGELELEILDIDFIDCPYEVFPIFAATLKGSLEKGVVSFSGAIAGLGERPFYAKGLVPVSIELPRFSLERDKPLALSLKGDGSIDPLLTFLESASLIAKGSVDLDLTVSGTLNEPNVVGHLNLEKGYLEDLTTGALFREGSFSMKGDGRRLVIEQIQANDQTNGSLKGKGEIICDSHAHFPFYLELDAKTFDLFTVDPLIAKASGHFLFSGSLSEITIQGEAIVDEAHLDIPDKLPVQVPTIDVIYINQSDDETPPIAPNEKRKIPLTWDLKITIPENLTIFGRGLESKWGGEMRISGEIDALSYSGELKAVSGTFNFANHLFTLSSGKIVIEGLKPNQIWINLETTKEFPSLTAIIGLRGTLDAPDITIASSPQLATNQILAWILFNSELTELTPFQACRLAHLLVKLSGTYAGPNVFSSIKEGLGLDVFDITHCDIDTADVTFQVGKYISEGVFVGVNKSISGDADALIIQTRLFRNFFLQGDYGTNLNERGASNGKIVLKWYKSY